MVFSNINIPSTEANPITLRRPGATVRASVTRKSCYVTSQIPDHADHPMLSPMVAEPR